ncbi:hypothetical protein [Priestia megaterium]|uniref:hypothetical protein n=1 Tax=Priestia megaterium TaxID=1404 RepID=UPI000BFD10E2|nr:hypothetical protein [Priestia megaterium]PGQ88303.1 hypothetical protein COA18_05075 [Priestia megaterium]
MTISAPRMNGELNEEELELRELLQSPNGFERYAAEKMPEFIQVQRDYEGFVRDVIQTTEVSPEDLVRVDEEVFVTYSKDVDATASVIARYGEAPTLYITGTTVKVTFFPVTTPRLTMTQWDIDTQPYDLMRRTQEKAGQELSKLEDRAFLDSVNALVESDEAGGRQTVTQAENEITKSGMIALKQVFSRNDVAFDKYLMNPVTYDSFLLWGENELDDTTQRTIFETGQLPSIWGGIKIVTGVIVDEKYVYGLAPKETLGRMPILRDVTIDVQRIPQTQDKEILAYEYIGMFIHSHLAIGRLELGAVGGAA